MSFQVKHSAKRLYVIYVYGHRYTRRGRQDVDKDFLSGLEAIMEIRLVRLGP